MSDLPQEHAAPRQPWLRALHVLTLSCLAFAHPILDLLGRTAEFLVIRRIGPLDLFTLLGLLLVVVPLPFVALAILGERIGGRAGRIVSGVVIGLLAGLIALRIESAANLLDGLPAVAAAAIAGLCAGALYPRFTTFRSFVTYLSPALLVVPAFFLLQTDVRRAVFPQSQQKSALAASGARAPIFFLIFDELSWAAIVDEKGLVDATRYPNLARLAGDATWYRNAHTVADTTNVALPAMLASRFPRRESLPLLADYPENIFTIFGGDYRIWADEPITRLCPPEINSRGQFAPPASRRLTALGIDLSIVWLHLTLPHSYRQHLPSIASAWEGFTEGSRRASSGVVPPAQPKDEGEFFTLAVSELTHGNRAERFRELLSNIDPDHDQSLYFSHVMLPHVPWEYLPSGRLYLADSGRVPGLVSEVWKGDPAQVRLAAVRYLMQVEFLDRLVGELIRKLEQEHLYEKSLLVLVADHGSSFHPGDKRRAYSPGNAADIVPVPLIIKAPGQTRGEIVDDPVSTLDILPTIMDILGVEPPTTLEGRSTRSSRPEVPRTTIVSTKYEGEQSLVISDLTAGKYESARMLAGMIGPPSDPYRFSRAAPNTGVLGRTVDTLPRRDGNLRATLFDEASYRAIAPDAARLPSLVTGAVRPEGDDCCDLALAVNGRIVATARTSPVTDELHHFSAILPEQILDSGFDAVRLFRVVGADGATKADPVLEATVSGRKRSYAIEPNDQGRPQALIVDGKKYVSGRKLDGWIESVDVEGDSLRITGWAADVTKKGLASEVVVFYRDKPLFSGATWVAKGHVAEAFSEPAYMFSGFSFEIPAAGAPQLAEHGLRLFALSDDGNATELGVLFVRIEKGTEGEYLVASNGKHYPVTAGALEGRIEAVEPDQTGTVVRGWAADPRTGARAERVVVLLERRVVKETSPSELRPDLKTGGGVLERGFRMHFDVAPEGARRALESGKARIFGISTRGTATELKLAAIAH